MPVKRFSNQDAGTADKNAASFADNAVYADRVATLTTYRHLRAVINQDIAGIDGPIDIGTVASSDTTLDW